MNPFFIIISSVLIVLLTSMLSAQTNPLAESSVTITQGPNWQPIENLKTIEAGSALDFSFLSDGPAGKYGKIVVRDGHFEFQNRPGVRAKFFGPNLCYDLNYPSKEDAPKIAELLQRMGYNVIRFHHYDFTLMPDSKKELDPARLDKLEYFFSCLKQRGIYIVIDLHSLREFTVEDGPDKGRKLWKEIVWLNQNPATRKPWELFARALLTHRNPYTKLTWAQDPALIGICPVNEDFFYHEYSPNSPYIKVYNQWLADKKITIKNDAEHTAAYIRFLTEMQYATNAYYKEFLNSLGVQALMTGANNVEYKVLTLTRQRFDYVDNHCYWNHPDCFPDHWWKLPWKQTIAVSELGRCAGIHRVYGPSRVLGKPFTVTEFNYCYPNLYRGEGGPLMGAYAAFQSWNGLFRFDFGHDADILQEERPAYVFGAVYDPINRLTEKMISLLFLRGDVSPAKKYIPYLVCEDTTFRRFKMGQDYFPDSFRQLAVCTGVGSIDATDIKQTDGKYKIAVAPASGTEKFTKTKVYWDDDGLIKNLIADKVIDANRCRPDEGRFISDTGQLDINTQKRTFKAVTQKSEAFVFENTGRLAGKSVTVDNAGDACTVFVGAVDDQPIQTSKRLLVMHLTDVQNDKIKFNKDLTIWEEVGQLPHLVRKGQAKITLRLKDAKNAKVWAVDLSGKRKAELAITRTETAITFSAETINPEGTFLVYEVVVEGSK